MTQKISNTLTNVGTKTFVTSMNLNSIYSIPVTDGKLMTVRDIASFDQGRPEFKIYTGGTTFYRTSSLKGSNSPWWSENVPASEIQWRIDQAVKPEWNSGAESYVLNIPKGNILPGYRGIAAYQGGYYIGGGSQVYLPYVPQNWVRMNTNIGH